MMEVVGFLADVTEDVFEAESDSATGDQIGHLEPTEERKANGNPNIRSVGYIKALKQFTSDYFICYKGE